MPKGPSIPKQVMTRQAIVTRFLPYTDAHLSRRILARADAGRIIVEWDDKLDITANHLAAAVALCKKCNWDGVLQGGGLPQKGTPWAYAFVLTDDQATRVRVRRAPEPAPRARKEKRS